MPRTLHAGVSTLRNRNRITNKTRLKIQHGNIEAEALLIPDEDEEKHRLTNLVAGVDAEDANEHHLQEVLTASQRTHAGNQTIRGDKTAVVAAPQAFIPTPGTTGVVSNYEEHYPGNRWRDPATFVCTSSTVEETIKDGLNGGFTYYMDERDKEWLDKINEEARGEGTSAQGAISPSSIRTSSRSAKSKGKEPESSQPVVMTEDEFELVMGVFEKVTHDKTEFLHHSLETGMAFPMFSDYQDTFSSPLPANMFTSFVVPSWVPAPAALLKIARAVYPYWKERRIQRSGHRIIPTLNFDEGDTLNESYICFRYRETKAVRKTRAQQTSSSDKLARLQVELMYPLELAKSILARETLKKEASQHAQAIWEKRLALVDLKRKFPGLGDKQDEELLMDKERVVKKQENRPRIPLKIRTQDPNVPVPRAEVSMRPRDRVAMIRDQVEATLAKQKDPLWEDQVDNPYQAPFVPYPSRLFKFIPPTETPSWPSDSEQGEEPSRRQPRSVRLRYGRGGRRHLDRRDTVPPPISNRRRRHPLLTDSDDEDSMDVDEDTEEHSRLSERWRFDMDDGPVIGPEGADEHDRTLVDDHDSKYLRYSMTLLGDQDHQSLLTDASLQVPDVDGHPTMMVPFRLGMPQLLMRPPTGTPARAIQPGMITPSALTFQNQQAATPVSMQQLKKMSPLNGVPQMRISSNGGMRPPSVPGQNGSAVHISPPIPLPVPQHSPPNSSSRPALSMPHVDVPKADNNQVMSALQNGIVSMPQPEVQSQDVVMNTRPHNPPQQMPTGFQLTPLPNHAAAALAVTAPGYQQFQNLNAQHALSAQQVQHFKTALASIQQQQGKDLAVLQQANLARGLPASYIHIAPVQPGGFKAGRPMWPAGQGIGGQQQQMGNKHVRTPSGVSPTMGHAAAAVPPQTVQKQSSPPRLPMTTASLQRQQPV